MQLKAINETLRRDLAQSQRAVDEQMKQTESWKTKASTSIAEVVHIPWTVMTARVR